MLHADLVSSLRLRITLAVTLALMVILGVFSAIHYARQREIALDAARTQAVATSNIIQAGLEHELLTADSADIRSNIENTGQQIGIQAIYLVDANGSVKFSHSSNNGAASAVKLPRGNTTTLLTTADGAQLMRHINLIPNQTQCYGCHNSQQPVLGALVSDFGMAETNRQLAADLEINVASGVASLLAVVLAVNLLLNRFVLDRLEQVVRILRRFGQGDLSLRLRAQGDDEIGQLASAFNQMAEELQARAQENARLYNQLAEKEAARTQLLSKVIAVQEEEHKRLARELHDDFAQSLSALSMTLQSAVETLPPEMHAHLDQVQALTMETLQETSRWIQDLRPRLLDDLGLVPAIRAYAESRLEARGIQVQIDAAGLKPHLSPEVEITLFRVIQEAISNIARHAHARAAQIRLDAYASGHVVARIEDDGVGFLPGKYLRAGDGLRGMGLLSMRERVALLGGTLMIDSTPGRGTRIRAEVPWKEMVQASAS